MKLNPKHPIRTNLFDANSSMTKKRPVSPTASLANAKRPKTKGGFIVDSSDDDYICNDGECSESDLNDEDEDRVSLVPPRTNDRAGSTPLLAKSLNKDRLKMLLGRKNTLDQRLEPTVIKQPSKRSHNDASKHGPVPSRLNYASQQRTSADSNSSKNNVVSARDGFANISIENEIQRQMRGSTSAALRGTSTQLNINSKQSLDTDSAFSTVKQRSGHTATSSQTATNLGQRSASIVRTTSQAQRKKSVSSIGLRTKENQIVITTIPHNTAGRDYLQNASTTAKAAKAAGALSHQNLISGVQQGDGFSFKTDSIPSQPKKLENKYQKPDVVQDTSTTNSTHPTLAKSPIETSSVTNQPVSQSQLTQNQRQKPVSGPIAQTLHPNKQSLGCARPSPNQPQRKPASAILVPRDPQPKHQIGGVVNLNFFALPNTQLASKRTAGEINGGPGENDTPLKRPVVAPGVLSTAPQPVSHGQGTFKVISDIHTLPRSTQLITNRVTKESTMAKQSIETTRQKPHDGTAQVAPIQVAKPTLTRAGQLASQRLNLQSTTADKILNALSRTSSTNSAKTDSPTTGPNNPFLASAANTSLSAVAIQSSNNPLPTPPETSGTAHKPAVSVDISSRSIPVITSEVTERLPTPQPVIQEPQQNLQSIFQASMNNLVNNAITTTVSAKQTQIVCRASFTSTQEEFLLTTPSSKSISIVESPFRSLPVRNDRVASTVSSTAASAPCIDQISTEISNPAISTSASALSTCHTGTVSPRTSRSNKMLTTAKGLRIDEGRVKMKHLNNTRPEDASHPGAKKSVVEDNANVGQSEHASTNLNGPALASISLRSNQYTSLETTDAENLLPPSPVVNISPKIVAAPSSEAQSVASSKLATRNPENLLTPPGLVKDAEPYFEYSIFQKLWASTQNESDITAAELISRPFINIDEANIQAELLFQNSKSQYTQHFRVLFSSINSTRDKIDCLTMLGTFSPLDNPGKKSYLKIWVQRDCVSKFANKAPQDLGLAPFISKSMYILRLFKLISSDKDTDTDTDSNIEVEEPPVRAYQPLPRTEIYTTLDAANRAARNLQIELSHERDPKSPLTTKWQEINLRELNAKVHAFDPSMGGKEACWNSTFNGCGLGADRFELVVEQVRLCGPRNL